MKKAILINMRSDLCAYVFILVKDDYCQALDVPAMSVNEQKVNLCFRMVLVQAWSGTRLRNHSGRSFNNGIIPKAQCKSQVLKHDLWIK